MAPRTLTDEQVGMVRGYLAENWSYSVIVKRFREMGITINKRIVSAIANDKYKKETSSHASTRGPNRKLQGQQLRQLTSWLNNKDPMTQAEMGRRLHISPKSVRNYIGLLRRRMVKKGKVHHLSDTAVDKRFKRSYPLYHRLKCGKFKRYITSDEAWVYLSKQQGKRGVQYLHDDQKWTEKENLTHEAHPKGFMVWVAFDFHRMYTPRFVPPKAKVSADVYINNILKPFIKEYKQCNPLNETVFQQDSAPAHTARKTQLFLMKNHVKYLEPSKWLPNSPDAAPCDYCFWGWLKSRLIKRKVSTLTGLRSAVRDEVKNFPESMRQNALRAWPKRCLRSTWQRVTRSRTNEPESQCTFLQ